MWDYEFDVRAKLEWHQVITVEAKTKEEAEKRVKEVWADRFLEMREGYSVEHTEGPLDIRFNCGGPPEIIPKNVLFHNNKELDGGRMLKLAQETGYPYIELGGQIFHAAEGKLCGVHTGYKWRRNKLTKMDSHEMKMPNLDAAALASQPA